MKIVNLTQHSATPEQVAEGVIAAAFPVSALLTFNTLPTVADVWQRARALAGIAAATTGCTHAMIGGAPYLMPELQFQLKQAGITPIYAFSERVSSEEVQPDGSVRKVNTFKHGGFYSPILPKMGEDDLSHEGE